MPNIPSGFESAVFHLDAALKRDHMPPCCIYVSGNGKPSIREYNKDGSTTTMTLVDDEWMVLAKIGGRE